MLKLFRYLKKYWLYALLAPLMMVIEVWMDMLITKQMQILIDDGIQASNIEVVKHTGIIMILFVALGVFGGIMSGVFGNIASCRYANDLRKDLYDKILKLSFNQTDKFSTSSLITRVTNDVTQMQTFIQQLIRFLIRQITMFVLGIIFTLLIDIRFGIVLLVTIPLELLVMAIFAKKVTPVFSKIQTKVDSVNNVVHENLTGARVVKAFSKENYENDRFQKVNEGYANLQWYVGRLSAVLIPAFMLIIYMAQVLIYAIGGANIVSSSGLGIAPNLSIGKITQATTYILMICFSLVQLAMVFVNFTRAGASAKRINEVLDCPLEIKDGKVNDNNQKIKGTVEFKNVSFAYPDSKENTLNKINLKINKGETVAIVGATGCGKTTLVNLITRFYDVTDGELLIDGINVKEYSQETLRSKIAISLQKSELFSGTIKENIKWGKLDATDDEVLEAATIAQAMEFINSRENKFEEYVEEKGTSLSGGQKQRLSIARAIIKKPEILIFDDSTSALDLVTEAKLYKAMRERINDVTRIVVAQRVATAKNADKIAVIENGSIIAYDSHENLLKNCKVYQDIYDSQLKREGVIYE